GTVVVQEIDSENWWKLTPDRFGSYELGSWSQIASFPAGYSPLYYASAVLPDGDLIVGGGEYIAGNFAFSKRIMLYDPLADSWLEIPAPSGWGEIGDASGMVLANGTFMLSDCCQDFTALLDRKSLTWTPAGAGKRDINDEESWALLPNGQILTVDCNNTTHFTQAELYDPPTRAWLDAGQTPAQITDLDF